MKIRSLLILLALAVAMIAADPSVRYNKATGNITEPTSISVGFTSSIATDNTYSGEPLSGNNSGATIAQWDAVYMGAASKWLLADCNGSGTYPARAIATQAKNDTQALIVLVKGIVRHDAWAWTPGGTIYLSGTPGGLTQTPPATSGDKVQQVGWAITADIAYFDLSSGETVTVQ